MTALLKAGDNGAQRQVSIFAGRRIVQQDRAAPATEQPGISAEQQEIAALHGQIEQAASAFAELEKAAEQASAEAYERGLADGKAQALASDQERLQRLADALQQGQTVLNTHFDRLETLSLTIAKQALAKIIGPGEDHAALMQQAIRHHIAGLSREMIVRIRVSGDDFPDMTDLNNLSRSLGGVELMADSQLASGQCVFDLKLGQYDASIDLQWERLRHLLDDLSRAEPLL